MNHIDIVYLSWNRLEFTKTSFAALAKHTDWPSVARLVIYDDGSTDGTSEWLQEEGAKVPVPAFEFRAVSFRAPAATMNDYVATSDADIFAKIDNDIAVPRGWLNAMLRVMRRKPEIELLGMEAARTGPPRRGVKNYGFEPASHMGGVGLIRTSAFDNRRPIAARGRFGWTEWQHRYKPIRGWIKPDLRVVQLDLIPEEPWRSLAAEYVASGWSRRWTPYDPLRPWWWEWIAKERIAA